MAVKTKAQLAAQKAQEKAAAAEAAALAEKERIAAEEADKAAAVSKELVVQQPGGVPAEAVASYADDAGAGMEGLGKDDLLVPMLGILETNSPEVAQKTIEGAVPGMLIIKSLALTFPGDVGVPFVPVAQQHVFVEWKTRDKRTGEGGGVVAIHPRDLPWVKKLKDAHPFGKITINANHDYIGEDGGEFDLVETYYCYGMIPTDDGAIRVIIPFTSTRISAFKAWMSMATSIMVPISNGRSVNPALWSHRYRLKTKIRVQGKFTSQIFDRITFDGATALAARYAPDDPIYLAGRDFHKQMQAGQIRADTRTAARDDHDDGGSQDTADMSGERVPF